jgi:hypothetical protein
MSFVKVPRSHQIWTRQMKRIVKWTIRIFFSAAVGFAVPVRSISPVSNSSPMKRGTILQCMFLFSWYRVL